MLVGATGITSGTISCLAKGIFLIGVALKFLTNWRLKLLEIK